jgi:hypothetical protein
MALSGVIAGPDRTNRKCPCCLDCCPARSVPIQQSWVMVSTAREKPYNRTPRAWFFDNVGVYWFSTYGYEVIGCRPRLVGWPRTKSRPGKITAEEYSYAEAA